LRALCLAVALLAAAPLGAQEKDKAKKKPAAAKKADARQPAQARGKPTPEQIRRFNELQKKQQTAK
jgi:hypothetical protein